MNEYSDESIFLKKNEWIFRRIDLKKNMNEYQMNHNNYRPI